MRLNLRQWAVVGAVVASFSVAAAVATAPWSHDSAPAPAVVVAAPVAQATDCPLVSADDVRRITGNAALAVPAHGVSDYDDVTTCLYRSGVPNGLLKLQLVPESPTDFKAGYQAIRQELTDNAGNRYYRHAVLNDLHGQSVEGLNNSAAYYLRSPKYGHEFMFVNYGARTLRIQLEPYSQAQANKLAAAVLNHSK